MPALRTIALVVIAAWGTAGYAAGLGPIRVQSALGQALHASVPVFGVNSSELTASCIQVALAHPDGASMMPVRAAVAHTGDAATIQLSTRQAVNEPAVTLNLQVSCGGSIQRSYQLLLDPVLSLPQLAQENQQIRPSADNGKLGLKAQPMIAPAEDGTMPATSRRAGSRRSRNPEPATGSGHAAVQPPATKAPAQPEARKVTRSVLKLSGDDVVIDTGATFSPGLKLTDSLSESRDTGDAQSAVELKKAYDRFAAILRDEDPAQASEKQLQDMQAKLQDLEKQTAALKEKNELQRQADQSAIERARREAVPSGWIIALGVLLLAALGAIGWLYRRIQLLGRQHSTELWEKTMFGQHTETQAWDNTLGEDDTFAAIDASTSVLTEAKHSDWERGVPLDDALAVDWASQLPTMQAPAAKPASKRASAHQVQGIEVEEAADEKNPSEHVLAAENPAQSATQTHLRAPQPGTEQKVKAQVAANVADTGSANKPQHSPEKNQSGEWSMEVEEISDLIQEAEFWMLLNDPERAIDMLKPCLEIAHPVSPVPWIYLLDLYRVTGKKDDYRALASRIKKVFNTNAPAWGEEAPMRCLRDYPHVVQKIEELWEGDSIISYLESLLLDEREGARAGFDLTVYREIVHLISVAQDPKVMRWRGQLNFDNSEPRQLSQKVSLAAADSGGSAPTGIDEQEADVFDRATSKQIVTRQVTLKSAALKAEASGKMAAAPAAPVKKQPVEPAVMEFDTIGLAPIDEPEPAISFADDLPPEPEPLLPTSSQATDLHLDEQATAASEETGPEDPERLADMARKLDLVLAYQEIGEHVGARVLLEEVIQGGSPLQVEKAKAMLKKLLKEIDWQ
ncbi:FimV/HubP family polar landmark protein [Paucimonas lemoignei]|nr:FimV/HubP family polar landmark protein [Paucimonas lemoignei]